MKSTKDIIKRILSEQVSPEGEEFSPPDGPPYNDYYDVGLALRRIVIDPDNGNWIDTDYIDEESIQTSWDLKEAEQMYQRKLYEIKFFDSKGKIEESKDSSNKEQIKDKIVDRLIGEIISIMHEIDYDDLQDILTKVYENSEFLFMDDDSYLSEHTDTIKKILSEYDFETKRIKTNPKTGSVTWDVIYDFKVEDVYEDLDEIIRKMKRAIEENPKDNRLTEIWVDAKNLRNRVHRVITNPR